jgi:hypothetical protein
MPIPFSCPRCGHSTLVDDRYAGQTGPCAKCGAQITVPSPRTAPNPGPAQPSQSPPSYPQAGYPQAGYSQAGNPQAGYLQSAYPTGTPPARGSSSWVTVLVILGVLGAGVFLVLLIVGALLFPAVGQARQAARRAQSMNNLKQIALAVHNYADTYKYLPYAGAEDREYGLAMSGRVRLLPFLEQRIIHDRVNYNEPWDSPANQWLSTAMPRLYGSPMQPPSTSNTTYLAIVDSLKVPAGDDTWDRKRPQPIFSQDARTVSFADINDGTSNTLMYLESDASASVGWESPRNWVFDERQSRRGLGMTYGRGFLSAYADGSVRMVENSVADPMITYLMLRNDGNVVFQP